ncbi:MAG: hypothetical protein JO225_08870 [Candidatus Eremiobacteraeota bacterium]|nr:hypothetical protein [Candidatus Eremiobacteraeota bacterium]
MKSIAHALLACCALIGATIGAAPAPIPALPPATYPVAATTRDGSHDFDFEHGTWRTHYRLLKKRLAGSHAWYDCYGTSVVRPFWGGSGNLEDGDLKCPNRYIGGMTIRTYSARTHQWTIWWGTRALMLAPPQQVGHYDANGVGEFLSYDNWEGKPIITRFRWTHPNGRPHFEQAFSIDHGKKWETNWTTDYTRVAPSTKGVWNTVAAHDGHDGFDFLFGTWKTHYMRLRKALVGSHDWYACDGTAVVRPFWGGSGNLEDGDLRCPSSSQYIRGVTLRLYDPTTRRWALYWGTQKNGLALGSPQVGTFGANGVGDFVAPDTWGGKPILVRYRWAQRNGNPHYEQAFSADHGKTWETNWTTDYTRVGPSTSSG